MIDAIRRLTERAYHSRLMSGAFYNTAAGRYGASADVPPYATRAALAAVLGLLLLLAGISAVMYDAIVYGISPMTGDDALSRGISSLLSGSVIPVIPGIPAIVHSIRVKRLLEAGDELEARRASNYARTWSRIALWTWIGLAVSWLAFTLTLMAAFAFILIMLVVIVLIVVLVLGGGLGSLAAGLGGGGGGGSDGGGGRDSGGRDDGKSSVLPSIDGPAPRFSEESVRFRRLREIQEQRRPGDRRGRQGRRP